MTARPRKFHQYRHDLLDFAKKAFASFLYRTWSIDYRRLYHLEISLELPQLAFEICDKFQKIIEMQSFKKMKFKTSNSMAEIIHSPKFSLEMKPHDCFILFSGKTEKEVEYYMTLRSISICDEDMDLQKLWYSPEVFKHFVTQFIAGHSLVAHIDITTVHPDSTEWQRIHFADIIRDDELSMRDEVIAIVLANRTDRQRAVQHYESNSTHFAMPTPKPLLVMEADSNPAKELIYDGSCVLPPDVRLSDRAHGPWHVISDISAAMSGGRMESDQMGLSVSSYKRKVEIPIEECRLTQECAARLHSKTKPMFQRTGNGKYDAYLPTKFISPNERDTFVIKHLHKFAKELPFSYDDLLKSIFTDFVEFKNVRVPIFISSTIDYQTSTVQHRVVLMLSVLNAIRIASGAKCSASNETSNNEVWSGNITWIDLRLIAERFGAHNVERMRAILSSFHSSFQSKNDFELGGPTAFTIDWLPARSVLQSFNTNYDSRIADPRPDDSPRSPYNLEDPLPKEEVDDDFEGAHAAPVHEASTSDKALGQPARTKREIDEQGESLAFKRCKQEHQPMDAGVASDQPSSSAAMHSVPLDRF